MSNLSAKGKNSKSRIIIAVAAAALVLAICVSVGYSLLGEQTSTQKTLEGYLDALYCQTLINEMTPYLVEDIQQICYNDLTLYGSTANLLLMMKQEKTDLVGEDMTLSVKADKEETASSTALSSASEAYGATQLRDVSFTVTCEGSEGSADFTGIARLAKVSGKWYLTEYDLPLTEKK